MNLQRFEKATLNANKCCVENSRLLSLKLSSLCVIDFVVDKVAKECKLHQIVCHQILESADLVSMMIQDVNAPNRWNLCK